MLTCVFHPLEPMRVVEDDEAERLKTLGAWFDCPSKAQKYREKVEAEVQDEKDKESTPKQRGSKR